MMGTLVGGAVVGYHSVDADASEGFPVGGEGELTEGRRFVDIEIDGAGEITAIMLSCNRDVVADAPPDRSRGSAQAFQGSEFAAGEVHAETVFGRRGGGEHVDRSAHRRAAVEGGIGSAHDLDTVGVVDWEVDDPGTVARVGLRHAVD